MKKRKYKISFFVLIFIFGLTAGSLAPAVANNIVIENISLVDQNTAGDTWDIQFDLAWEHSWFITGAPGLTANWDAAWVFFKYSVYSGGSWSAWNHCTLLNSGYTAPAGSQMSFGDTGGVDKGAFIYRSSAGSGSVDWNDAEIRWNYAADGLADNAVIKIKAFAVEMVYIPAGDFYAGDGTNRTGGTNSHFFDAADSADPRDAVGIGSTRPYISNVNTGIGTTGDITWVNESTYSGNLPAERTQIGAGYPTGYDAFYIMKYEISQGQYCEFLNTLTSTQSSARITNQYGNYRNYIKLAANGKYGCDADNDAGAWASAEWSLINESNDGEWTACNYLSWMDAAAYADWAGLRPFTELEFEKAARGGQAVTASEYAWGSTSIVQATGITNNGQTSEVSANAANCVYGNHASVQGPLRCGALTDSDDTREEAGASYYGVMELSGNLWERPVSVMDSQTGQTLSDFTGTHGDGSLSSAGFATNSDWPGTDALGAGFRGGNWYNTSSYARVSDRYIAAYANTYRDFYYGCRAARTSP